MIYGENQNRQFYVVNSNHAATPKVSGGKYYVKFNDVTTDKIQKGHIRDIRITKPQGTVLNEYNIAVSGGSVYSGEDYILYFDFKNWLGFGENDRYLKFAAVHCTAAMAADVTKFYEAMGKQIEAQFAHEAIKPFDVLANPNTITISNEYVAMSGTYTTLVVDVSAAAEGVTESSGTVTVKLTASAKTLADLMRVVKASGKDLSIYANGTATAATTITALSSSNTMSATDGLYLRVKSQPMTKKDIIMGNFRLPLEVNITSSEVYDNSGNRIDSWADVTKDVWRQYSNAAIIAGMEYFFMKGRADMYGYMGFPNVNPTEMLIDPASTDDYYVLDIKHYFQDQGMLNQNSEKEMTFVSTNKSSLEALIYDSTRSTAIIAASATGTTLSGGRDCEIYTVAF